MKPTESTDDVISESVRYLLGTQQNADGGRVQRPRKSRVVTATQIRELQNNDKLKDRFVVVDVRSKAESDVSIIPGAITKIEFEQTESQHVDKAVIAYCTIGYRSGIYVRGLKRKGWNAWNYKGSILNWCKNRLPLTTINGETTKQVHTYNRWLRVPSEYTAVY